MTAGLRRGACPTLPDPMPTGDGLLVRLPAMRLAPETLRALCEAARRHGNGTIEVTARGSLQIRGLTAASAPLLARDAAGLDLPADALAPKFPVSTSPLAGLVPDPADLPALADALRRRGSALSGLGPKVSVAIDGDGPLHLDAVPADIRLRATAQGLHLSLGGRARTATPLGWIARAQAADAVLRLLRLVAARGPAARIAAMLASDGLGPFRAALGRLDDGPALAIRPPSEPIGRHPLPGGRIATGIAAAFGGIAAADLEALLIDVQARGVTAVETAPGQALLLVGPADAGIDAACARHGFITRADDPRRRITACAGAPACAAGLIATRTLAAGIAPVLDGSFDLHLSGCRKGCAAPGHAGATIVGEPDGAHVVAQGITRAIVAPDRLADFVRRHAALFHPTERTLRP